MVSSSAVVFRWSLARHQTSLSGLTLNSMIELGTPIIKKRFNLMAAGIALHVGLVLHIQSGEIFVTGYCLNLARLFPA